MSRREDVDNAIWGDPDYLELSPHAKLLYLWSFTNPRCGMAGLYKVAPPQIVADTGLNDEQLGDALGELETGRFVFYDGRMVFVRSRVKHLRSRSGTMAQSVRRDVDAAGDHPFVGLFAAEYGEFPWLQKDFSGPGRWVPGGPSMGHGGVLESSCETRESLDPSGTPPGVPGQGQGQGQGVSSSSTTTAGRAKPPIDDAPPKDLDPALVPLVEPVTVRLREVAEAKGAKPVTLIAVGRAIRDYPTHDHLAIATEFVAYWLDHGGQPKPMKDIVQTYRGRLQTVPAPPKPRHLAAVDAGRQDAAREDALLRSMAALDAEARQLGFDSYAQMREAEQ